MTLPIAARCELVVHIAVIAVLLVALGTLAAQRIVVSGVVEFAEITEWVARLPCWLVDHSVPAPTANLSTSPGKYEVLWRVEGFDSDRQEKTLKQLAIRFGGDPACTECNRVLRIPGFLNQKYDPADRVTVEYSDDSVWAPGDFQLDIEAIDARLSESNTVPRKSSARHTNSEVDWDWDWDWACDQLAHGKDAVKLTRELAARRSDRPSPVCYAQRTVDAASARLRLIEGIRIDDVITMLEFRRRYEISGALCCARTREIAATVQRMITRRKTA